MIPRTDEQAPTGGRSRERAEQDALLEREAQREPWLKRLRRNRAAAKGRPDPGDSKSDDVPNRDRSQP